MVSSMENTSPTPVTRLVSSARARLSLPSHSGWRAGSAISSKIVAAGA
jgi:hypothetical protein